MRANRIALTVAEGLLPLLDVSVLLLGLLFVLWNVAAARQVERAREQVQKQAQQQEQLPGISMIIRLTVEANGQLQLYVPQKEGKNEKLESVSLKQPEDLKSVLEKTVKNSTSASSKKDSRPLVLIIYRDPWRMKTDLGPRLVKALREAGCRYARVFP